MDVCANISAKRWASDRQRHCGWRSFEALLEDAGRIDMCMHVCIDMCIDMRMEMCTDMCTDICMVHRGRYACVGMPVWGHAHRHV